MRSAHNMASAYVVYAASVIVRARLFALCVSCLGPAAGSARQVSDCFFRVSADLCEDQNQSADMDGEDVQSADCQDHRPQPAVKRRKSNPQPIGDSKTDPQPISDSEELGGEANFCLGQEHNSAEVREREGSEWPPDF